MSKSEELRSARPLRKDKGNAAESIHPASRLIEFEHNEIRAS